VNELFVYEKSGNGSSFQFSGKVAFSAMIEARSCERFKVLSENIQDEELAFLQRFNGK
jgi:tRNA-(ms[2]io[6]A)-hydroxylase